MTCEIYALGKAGRSLKYSLDKYEHEEIDILFLSVPDQHIYQTAQKIADSKTPLPACVAHLSGAYGLELLEPLLGKTAIAQFHPLAALTGNGPIPESSLCRIAASDLGMQNRLSKLAKSLRLNPVFFDPAENIKYHAAAVFTGNLSLALVAKSIGLMQEIGIEEETARKGLSSLLKSVCENIDKAPVSKALTGPIARKDNQTIQKHLAMLNSNDQALYRQLADLLMQS